MSKNIKSAERLQSTLKRKLDEVHDLKITKRENTSETEDKNDIAGKKRITKVPRELCANRVTIRQTKKQRAYEAEK